MLLTVVLVLALCCCYSGGVFSFSPIAVQQDGCAATTGSIPFFSCQVKVPARRYETALYAKKKKNKQKTNKGTLKKSGFEWASSFTLKPFEAKATRELAASAISSFEGRTGKPLSEDLKGVVADLPKALWNAPIACVVILENQVKYANVAALETVGLQPHEFERLLTSDNDDNDGKDSEQCVEINLQSTMNGDKKYESGYSKKILKSKDGDDITIVDAHRWLIEKSALLDGKFVTEMIGVAYAWKEWMLGDSIVCSPGGQRREVIDEENLKEAVQNQAAAIRELKEGQGLGNKDPQVMDAVQELLRLKSLLADAQAK